MKKFLNKTWLLAAVMFLALTGCAALPYRSGVNRPSMFNDGGLYNGYCWNNGCAPYVYGPFFGFNYGWMPDEEGGDGFIGGGGDNFDDEDGGPGR
jgi:hypothetical protein